MPDLRMRKLLLVVAVTGLLLACGGLFQAIGAHSVADFGTARALLLAALAVLVPVFVYMIRLRSGARRVARARALEQQRAIEREMATLRTPEGVRAVGGAPSPEDAD